MTIIDDIRHAHRLTAGYRLSFWLSFFPMLFLLCASQLLNEHAEKSTSIGLTALQLVIQLITIFAVIGLYRFGLSRAREQDCHVFSTVWSVSKWRQGLAYLGASILVAIILMAGQLLIGLLAHILPGELVLALALVYFLVIAFGAVFIPLIILDGQLPWYKAVFGSFVLIRYGVSDFLQFILAALVMIIVSIFTFGILFIWVFPLLFVLAAGTYQRLLNRAKS
ncbi:hypothetical protein [Piscirickettsia litoralis]|uniref:Beta-carotene 15,15'-monooxygenase n=1 Tax=Piscirickettsia litoralis TaxID=1891921 RepID=A0ABX3A3Q5_9GAMM|nr:hypothetical protein [Piscirickettsia litoralis]ODN43155.1 hypothetical protein BGC07_09815 [Piscirickettsia litoralis]